MADANEMCELVLLELNKLVLSDTDETEEEQQRFSGHEEEASDDFPSSLLSYFETSKSRAAACEKLILEDLEDFTASHHTDGAINVHNGLNKDVMKLNEKNVYETENEVNKCDDQLYHALTETQALFTHSVTLCTSDEGADKYLYNEEDLASKISEYEAEREKCHCEEMQIKEQRRQREMDFQEELRKIMEAEKLHQIELEVVQRRAQEKLEQELLLQQELMSNLQKGVEQERKRIKEEQKKNKEEEERKKQEKEEKKKREEEDKKKMKEKEEKRKREEEDIRKRLEEKKRLEEEEKRKHLERTLKEEEGRRQKEEEERKKKEEDEKRKSEEEKNKIEKEMRKKEEESKIKEIQLQEEKKRRQTEEKERKNEEKKQKEREKNAKQEEDKTIKREDTKNMTKVAGKKITEDEKRKEEEEIQLKDDLRIMKEEKNMRDEEEERITKTLEVMRKQGEITEKEVERESDEERQKSEVLKEMDRQDGQIRRKEMETGKIEMQLKGDEEKKNQDEEMRHSLENQDMTRSVKEKKTKEEKLSERQEEDMRRDIEDEIRSKQEMVENKGCEADDRKTEHETVTKGKKRRQEEVKKHQEKVGMGTKEEEEDGTRNIQPGKRHNGEGVREIIKENLKTEERILKEKWESFKSQNESKSTRHSVASQLGVSTALTSPSSPLLHSRFTAGPTSSVTAQHDPQKNITQIYLKTIAQPHPGEKPCTSSCSLPVSLPEHTEQKRLLWMKDCISWSKLSLQNRRKQKRAAWSRKELRRAAEASSLPPLCPHTLLQSTGRKSLQEVTMVTLEDLPGCSLSTLVQCTHLRSLTLRRCGLKSLEGISQLQELCYIDLQENDISFVDCENMTSLQVLRLAHNKLTSIHGLCGADSLDVLDLSHNSITRIAGLESVRRLQRLSVNHNQLISTKGLKDVYTLLHLDCSHNHLASIEGLENNALLHTLDLRSNSLTEPPSLKNQVLLRELHLDDNSISSLQGLTACWLPLLQDFSAAQNRITQLPSMSDFLSLENLDLSFNCLSELCDVCENLDGCQFLREVHLVGNPLQQETGWRSTLQRALPGLRAIDSQQTDSFLSHPAVQQVSLASGSFLTFCQAQLQQTHDLQECHSRELSNASSPLEAVKSVCQHFTVTLKLAENQRFAHEYGDTTVCDEHWVVDQIPPEKTMHMDSIIAEKLTECPKMNYTNHIPAVIPSGDNIRCSYWSLEDIPAAESQCDTFDSVTMSPKTEPTVTRANSGSVHCFATKGKTNFFSLEKAPVPDLQDSDLKNKAAVVIQQWWRKYKGNINATPFSEKGGERGGDGGAPESGPSYINKRAVGCDYAATVIQAFWRGFTLRRSLASALAAVKCPGDGEDDTFEEVDVDEFVFDEAALEKHWTLTLSEDSPSRHYPVSEQSLSLKPLSPCLDHSQYILPPPLVQSPKQAWAAGEHVDLAAKRISPEVSNRSKSLPSTTVLSGLSERSEKIMEEWGFTDSHTAHLMLRRAQKMKPKKQQQKKHRDPFVRLAFFNNCNYQMGPVEARNRLTPHNGKYVKVGEAELSLQQAKETEQMKPEQAQQWLHTKAAQSERHSESEHFLPEIDSSILSGGRVQLVADPAYADCQHHTSGLCANSSFAAQPCKVNCSPHRNSLGHARKEVPSPRRVTSAPSKKERISFRDNPVQLSSGWGGGKKRDRVYK